MNIEKAKKSGKNLYKMLTDDKVSERKKGESIAKKIGKKAKKGNKGAKIVLAFTRAYLRDSGKV